MTDFTDVLQSFAENIQVKIEKKQRMGIEIAQILVSNNGHQWSGFTIYSNAERLKIIAALQELKLAQ